MGADNLEVLKKTVLEITSMLPLRQNMKAVYVHRIFLSAPFNINLKNRNLAALNSVFYKTTTAI